MPEVIPRGFLRLKDRTVFGIFFLFFRGFIQIGSPTDNIVYFKAPPKFLGDKRTAYQHNLTFYLRDEDDYQLDTTQGDVILKGKWFPDNLVYKFDNDKRPGTEFSMFTVSILNIVSSVIPQYRNFLHGHPVVNSFASTKKYIKLHAFDHRLIINS